MEKLVAITAETQRFLKMVAEDVHVRLSTGGWIAKDFANNSVDFTAEYVGIISPLQFQACHYVLKSIMAEDFEIEKLDVPVRRATILQYAKIARPIDPDEAVRFGLFKAEHKRPSEHFVLSKERALDIEEKLSSDDLIEYLGSVQGVIHSVIIEGRRTSFTIRELYTDNLIKCFYDEAMYRDLVETLKKREAIVHVSGWVTASRLQRKPLWMTLEKIKPAEEYIEGDLEKFIGSSPNLTGRLSTEQFIDHLRSDDN